MSCGQARSASWCTHSSMPWTPFLQTLTLLLAGCPCRGDLNSAVPCAPGREICQILVLPSKAAGPDGPFDVLQLYREAVSAGAEVTVPCLCSGRLPQDPGAGF